MEGRILDRIELPQGLRTLNHEELSKLASEVRQEIISVVSKNGGHLAPSLGTVEMAIALHRVLDSPRDKIIWDVGHQAYAHKILTGRRDEFHTLRQFGGISGFPRMQESPHDAFGTGHSSTSISCALGIAKARDLAGEDFTVVAVIGDGSLTAGMAFEALDHAGHLGTDLIVVLNDNEMSISRNVGALASYLGRLRMAPTVRMVKGGFERAVRRIPWIGEAISGLMLRVKGSIKYLVVPGMFFEELGFTYIGPIDGHDIGLLSRAVQDAREKGGPVLIHAVTQKGRGYEPAERDPRRFHSVGPFDSKTGASLNPDRQPTFTERFAQEIIRLAAGDERIVAITAAMPDGTGLDGFARAYPERFFDVGIAEQHAVTFACGLARQGLVPVVAIYSSFLQRAYDQILHDLCLQDLHVVLMIDRAGLVGEDGPTHHGAFDIAYLRHIPGMTLLAPRDGNELADMLKFAVNCAGPVAIRYPKACSVSQYPRGPAGEIQAGRGQVLSSGEDLGLIAVGSMVDTALRARELLAERGIDVTCVNARFVKPLDEELILSVASTTRGLITLEEGTVACGFGSAVLELLAARGEERGITGVRVKAIGIPDEFIPHGRRDELLRATGLTPEAVADAAFEFYRQLVRGHVRRLRSAGERDIPVASSGSAAR